MKPRATAGIAIGWMLFIAWVHARGAGETLEQNFKNPPDVAKPRTWWHWTKGNVTKEGMTKDLEWMKTIILKRQGG